jgi:hypothetical protein
VGALVIIQAAVNVPSMLRNHAAATPYLSEAEGLNQLMTPRDWIILDFDDVSSLWWAVWGYEAKSLLLPASTAENAKKWLDAARQDCERSDARMLFVGVLDHDRRTWDGFLGTRVGIPFEMLDEYRTHSTVLKSYSGRSGTIVVRQYRPGASGLEYNR